MSDLFKVSGLRNDNGNVTAQDFVISKDHADPFEMVSRLNIYHGWIAKLATTFANNGIPVRDLSVIAVIDDKGNIQEI